MAYYLWLDKKSTENQVLVYITDYKEFTKDGKPKIDGQVNVNAELVFTGISKVSCIEYAKSLMRKE